jgi:hypothetical protein
MKSQWDLDNMEYNWDFVEDEKRVFGTASGGW